MAQNYCSYNLPLEASNIILHRMESIYTQTIASRGWHVYGKTSWKNPKKGQTVFAEKEQEKIALLSGPVHIAPYSYENGYKSIRFCLAFTLLRYENGDF